MKKAILFGASGLVGSSLLNELLHNEDYDLVTIVTRKRLELNHSKLKQLTGDFFSLRQLEKDILADDVFITLGTTRAKTPDQNQYYQADHDYPLAAAHMAKQRGATSVLIVSAVGADVESRNFYLRTKAAMERDIIALDFAHTHIFRPSLLLGKRKEKRLLEKFFQRLFPAINILLAGPLKKFRAIDAHELALAINRAAGIPANKVNVYQWPEIKKLLTPGV